jgi:tetratricopeptide (TPR) repeat protein
MDMRRTILPIALLPLAFCLSAAYAQAPSLPAGTSSPSESGTISRSATSLISKAEDAITQSDYGKAVPLLKQATTFSGATPREVGRAWYDLGYIEQVQDNNAAAEANFQKAVAADPKQFEAHSALGRLLAHQQKWKSAKRELEAAATLQPASGDRKKALAEVYRMLARVEAQLGDAPAASDALLAALKLTPETPADTLFAAQLAESEQDDAGAAAEYKKALAANPKSEESLEGLARTLIHQGKYDQAEAPLKQALAKKPSDPRLLAESATMYAAQGKAKEAIAQVELLHNQEPQQTAVTRMLADLLNDNGQPEKAAPLYKQLVAADPKNPDLLTAQGENFMRLQKWPEAAAVLRKSLEQKRDQGDAWSALAFADSENHEYTAVLTALDNRAKYLPDVPATVFIRATALDHLHRTPEAIPLYQKFLREGKGKFPDEEAQTRKRLAELGKKP